MRSIKPIALKEAKILSNEEMKNLFGGSAAVEATCHTNSACTIEDNGVEYSGQCVAKVTKNSMSCYCAFSSGNLTISGSNSACFNLKN